MSSISRSWVRRASHERIARSCGTICCASHRALSWDGKFMREHHSTAQRMTRACLALVAPSTHRRKISKNRRVFPVSRVVAGQVQPKGGFAPLADLFQPQSSGIEPERGPAGIAKGRRLLLRRPSASRLLLQARTGAIVPCPLNMPANFFRCMISRTGNALGI